MTIDIYTTSTEPTLSSIVWCWVLIGGIIVCLLAIAIDPDRWYDLADWIGNKIDAYKKSKVKSK